MRSLTMALLFAWTMAGAGCDPNEDKNRDRGWIGHSTGRMFGGELRYFQDKRINPPICFAVYNPGHESGLLATVPCEQVRHLLVNK